MRNRGFLVFTILLARLAVCDIEKCLIIEGTVDFQTSPCPSQISSNGSKFDLECDGKLITKAKTTDKSGIEKTYDGFVCVAHKKQFKQIRPCKKYLHYVESKNGSMPKTMKCFRQIDEGEKRTGAVIILNEKGVEDNVYKRLIQAVSFATANQFLYKMIDFLAESNAGFIPIFEPSNSAYWMKGNNIIWEVNQANQFSVRLRFIDTSIERPSPLQRKRVIEEGFHFIKKFVNQNESCKHIVWREYSSDKTLNALIKLDPSFPKNYRRIFQKLAKTCDKETRTSPSPKIRHQILLKIAIYGYCMQQIRYDNDGIQALRDMVGSLTLEDQYFESTEDRASWFNAVRDALGRKALEADGKFEDSDLKKSIQDYIKNHVKDEPVFKEVNKKERRLMKEWPIGYNVSRSNIANALAGNEAVEIHNQSSDQNLLITGRVFS